MKLGRDMEGKSRRFWRRGAGSELWSKYVVYMWNSQRRNFLVFKRQQCSKYLQSVRISQKQIHSGCHFISSSYRVSGYPTRVLPMKGRCTEPSQPGIYSSPLLFTHICEHYRLYLLRQRAVSSVFSFPGYQGSLLFSPQLVSWGWILWVFSNYIVMSICYEYLSIFLALFSFKGPLWNSQEQHSHTSKLCTLNALQMDHNSSRVPFHLQLSGIILTTYNICLLLSMFQPCCGTLPRFPSVFLTASYCLDTFLSLLTNEKSVNLMIMTSRAS